MEEKNSKKESGGGCLSTIVLIVIIFFAIRSCSSATNEKKGADANEPAQKSATNKEDRSIDTPRTTNIYDEAVSVVDLYIQAELDRNIETALTYCTDSLENKVYNSIREKTTELSSANSELMDILVGEAQLLFDSYEDSNDIINADYLYDDSDMKEACAQLTESIYRNSRIYSLPEKAEMISDTEAVVTINYTAKDYLGTEYSLLDDIKSYLENIVIEKLMDNSNFIKKIMVKKVVKKVIIDCAEDLKNKYEETEGEMPIGRITYYLTKENGKWLINKIEVEDFSSQDYDEGLQKDYFENEEAEEPSESIDVELEDNYYEDEMEAQYILPHSSDEYLSDGDVEILSEEECRIARNEIYARHGRKFDDRQLQDYFDTCSWYVGTISPEDFSENLLNEVEKANLQMIADYEEEMGY